MSKRSPEILIADIIDSITKIETYTSGLEYAEFINSDLILDAVSRNFTVIGEAANRLPKDFTENHNHIDWANIISFRNRIVHEYFGIDSHITWQIIINDLNPLKQTLLTLK